MRIKIDMGLIAKTAKEAALAEAEPALLDLEELLATRLLVQGNSGSGKSHLLRRLLEQSAEWVQQCVIDPEGDFVTLADKFGHIIVEAGRTPEELARIAARIRKHRVSVVLNLEGLEADGQMRAAAAFLNGLFEAERDCWYPLLAVVDEAQLFAPAGAAEVSEEARRQSLSAMTNLMCRGRKRGLAGIIATQRLAKLAKNVAAEASNFLMGRTFLDIDMARAADLLGMERRQAEMFRDLARGHFIALGPALSRRPLPIKIGSVETAARSGSPKLLPLPEAPADAQELIFTPAALGAAALRVKAAPKPPARPTEDILREVAENRAAGGQEQEGAAAASLFPEIAAREDAAKQLLLRRIMAEIWAECCAIYQKGEKYPREANLYQDFQVRCRICRLPGAMPDLPAFRRLLSFVKSDCDAETEQNPLWAEAVRLAQSLDDDVQAIFLKLAVAAIKGAPCPPDAALARLYGTHSSRARSVLGFFEKRGLIVARMDFAGKRIVIFPDLGAETAAGAADAEDVIETIAWPEEAAAEAEKGAGVKENGAEEKSGQAEERGAEQKEAAEKGLPLSLL